MAWAHEEQEEGNTEQIFETQTELHELKDEYEDLKERVLILEPRAAAYKAAIQVWYKKQSAFLQHNVALITALRDAFVDAYDPSDRLETGLGKMGQNEMMVNAHIKKSIEVEVMKALDHYMKNCRALKKRMEKWTKSHTGVDHYCKKCIELCSTVNLKKHSGGNFKKEKDKLARNEIKLDRAWREHKDLHDEVRAELKKFWDEREDFFDGVIKDVLFGGRHAAEGTVTALDECLKSLGMSDFQIEREQEEMKSSKKTHLQRTQSVTRQTSGLEQSGFPSRKEEAGGGTYDDDDGPWAEDPVADPY